MKLVGHLPMELSFLICHFSLKKLAVRTKCKSIKVMDQGDWKTDLLSLDPSSPERPAEQSPQNLKKRSFVWRLYALAYPARRGYIFAVWAGVRKVASADNRSILYRACAKFVTRFASNWFIKSAWVSRELNLRKLPANYSPRAFVLFFCFAPSGFKYFSRKISTDGLF